MAMPSCTSASTGLIGMASDAGHALGLVSCALGAGGIGRRFGLGGMAGDAVGLHGPVHRLARRCIVTGRLADVLLGGGTRPGVGRRLARRAAQKRRRQGRHGEHGQADRCEYETAMAPLHFTFHGILLSSRARLGAARREAAVLRLLARDGRLTHLSAESRPFSSRIGRRPAAPGADGRGQWTRSATRRPSSPDRRHGGRRCGPTPGSRRCCRR